MLEREQGKAGGPTVGERIDGFEAGDVVVYPALSDEVGPDGVRFTLGGDEAVPGGRMQAGQERAAEALPLVFPVHRPGHALSPPFSSATISGVRMDPTRSTSSVVSYPTAARSASRPVRTPSTDPSLI